jgi:hypothetical protein
MHGDRMFLRNNVIEHRTMALANSQRKTVAEKSGGVAKDREDGRVYTPRGR